MLIYKCRIGIYLFLFFVISVAFIGQESVVIPESADKLTNPYPVDAKTLVSAAKIYKKVCWICHGDQGKGTGPGASELSTKPADFNDPFDCLPKFTLEATEHEIKNYLVDRFPKIYPNLGRHERRAQIKSLLKNKRLLDPNLVVQLESAHRAKIMEQTGVFCLSAVPDHILMWSHYTMAHSGICIEFEATSNTEFFGFAQQVHYQKDYPVLNIIRDSADEILRKALLTKADFWDYEKEWRITWKDIAPGAYKYPEGLLKGVIFGARIRMQDRDLVLSWIDKMAIKPALYQATLKSIEYGLDINPL